MGPTNCKLQNIDTIYQPDQMNSDHTFIYVAIANVYR